MVSLIWGSPKSVHSQVCWTRSFPEHQRAILRGFSFPLVAPQAVSFSRFEADIQAELQASCKLPVGPVGCGGWHQLAAVNFLPCEGFTDSVLLRYFAERILVWLSPSNFQQGCRNHIVGADEQRRPGIHAANNALISFRPHQRVRHNKRRRDAWLQ